MIKNSMTIFFVKDQETAKNFYVDVFAVEPIIHVPGMTEFELSNGSSLGLMPLSGIKQIVGEEHFTGQVDPSPKAELYVVVTEAQTYLDRATQAGAKQLVEFSLQNWGDHVGYCLSPEGHLLAFAEAGANE